MSNNINWKEIRAKEFPVLETMTFLDAACVSFAPQRAVNAVKAFADMTACQEEANSSCLCGFLRRGQVHAHQPPAGGRPAGNGRAAE